MFTRTLITVAATLSVPIPAVAQTVLFTDDFESDLSQWTGKNQGVHSAQIVVDPLDASNHVVTFSEATAYGDIFSAELPVMSDQLLMLTFDYLGFPVDGSTPGSYGGFVGYSDDTVPSAGRWLVGTDPISGADPILIDDGAWHSYAVPFDPYELFVPVDDRIHIMVEDHIPPTFDVFFDNFRVETMGPVSTETSTWATIKAQYRK